MMNCVQRFCRPVGGIVLVTAMIVAGCTDTPSEPRPLTISKATTYITSPLKPDGEPDYAAWLNQHFGKGVTRENNLVVGLLEVMEASPERDKLAAAMGVKVGGSGPRLHPAEIDDAMGAAEKRPWTDADHPKLAAWLKQNNAAIDRLVEVSHRDRWFVPVPPHQPGESLVTAWVASGMAILPDARRCVAALVMRADHRIAGGDFAGAMGDWAAARRMADVLAARSAMEIERLVGAAGLELTDHAVVGWVESGRLKPDEAQRLLRWMDRHPDRADAVEAVEAERVFQLDELLMLRRDLKSGVAALMPPRYDNFMPGLSARRERVLAALGSIDVGAIDWDAVLRESNRRADRAAAAMVLPTFAAREAAVEVERAKLVEASKRVERGPGGDVERWLVDLVAAPFPEFRFPLAAAHIATDIRNQTADVARVAVALVVYRGRHGEYPAKLDELVPGVLGAVPGDFCSGKAMVYRRTATGFVLYSVGRNMKDDGGNGDDIVVRVGGVGQ